MQPSIHESSGPTPTARRRAAWLPIATRRLAAVIGAILAAIGCQGSPQSPSRPNVVVVLIDTLRADHLGAYGYRRDTSPRIDAFAARDGVRFERAFSPSSWTRPATASLLTGVHPLRHKAVTRANAIAPDIRLLGEHLRRGGYQTAGFVTNPNIISAWGFDRGFDVFVDVEQLVGSDRADAVWTLVEDFLETKARPPFFLYVHLMDPHTPYDAPEPFDRRWRTKGTGPLGPHSVKELGFEEVVAAYDQEIAFADHYFGELVDDLTKRGWYDDAVVVLTSDHGEEFRDHGGYFHGHTLLNELVHVPLIVKMPDGQKKGGTVSGTVSLLDVAPTILRHTSIEVDGELDGIDLTDSVRRGHAPADRELMLDLNLILGHVNFVSDALVQGDVKLIRRFQPRPTSHMFDITSDWPELKNLTVEQPDVAGAMTAELDRRRAASAEGIHAWLVGESDDRARAMEVSFSTDGRFRDAQCQHGPDAGHVVVAADGQQLRIRATVQSTDNPRDEIPTRIVGVDEVEFRVEPADARVVLVAALSDGAPVPVRTGGAKAAALLPLAFDATTPALAAERKDLLFGTSRDLSITDPSGVYLAVSRPADIPLDDATRERLRALGYIDGHE